MVAYDGGDGSVAARAWWLLRWAGHGEVAVLDGGYAAWTALGHEGGTGPPGPAAIPGDFEVRPGRMPVLDADQTAALAAGGSGPTRTAGVSTRGLIITALITGLVILVAFAVQVLLWL